MELEVFGHWVGSGVGRMEREVEVESKREREVERERENDKEEIDTDQLDTPLQDTQGDSSIQTLPTDLECIDLTHRSLSQLPTLQLANCHQLLLRRNKLSTLPPDLCIPHCWTLDLYDNLLTSIPHCISKAPALQSLDLSFNRIYHISRVQLPPTLQLLYASCNKIDKVDEFASANELKLMEFGGNGLREIPVQWQCSALEELWLASNALQFQKLVLVGCPKLRILALQCNRLQGEIVLQLPSSIEELWLANNSISALCVNCSGVDVEDQLQHNSHQLDLSSQLPRLNTLDIASNAFTELPSWLPRLAPSLTDLDFKWNRIENLSNLLQTLSLMPNLGTVWMRNNPATATASNVSRIYHSAKGDWSSKSVTLQDI